MAVNAALAGLVMLIVGDSHIAATSFFNDALQDALVSQGAAVHSFGVCGAAGADWINPAPIVCGRGERHNSEPARIDTQHNLRGWALPDLINKYKPNLVVIELGDTLAGYGVMPTLPRALIDEQVRELLIPIKSRNLPCIWIGPPWGTEGGPYKKTNARLKEVSDYLAQVVAPCKYIDSTQFSKPGEWPTRDGIHLTLQATRVWDNHLITSIDQIARQMPRR
ncbi:MAG TPA: SGNH/GDSL hydrolase family protein [Stellaceae bacterium]|jgi:hypothetical protein|nr:SGNH/GDSL hydrolase family protein [Stellaceae bacterium]